MRGSAKEAWLHPIWPVYRLPAGIRGFFVCCRVGVANVVCLESSNAVVHRLKIHPVRL